MNKVYFYPGHRRLIPKPPWAYTGPPLYWLTGKDPPKVKRERPAVKIEKMEPVAHISKPNELF